MRHLRLLVALLVLVSAGFAAQSSQAPQDYIPPELQAADPQVKALIDAAEKSSREGNYPAAFQQIQKALDLCGRRHLLADKALVESHMAVVYFVQGKLKESGQYRLSSFADAVQTGNLVLQADDLVALASGAQTAGNMTEALDLSSKALDTARRSKSLWIQSRALGELGRLQLTMGKAPEARTSVEEALNIDRLNHYGWEPSHLLYLAWITFTGKARVDQAIELARSARDLSILQENYLVFMQASTSLAQAYALKGQVNESITLLESSRAGVSGDGQPLFQRPESYRASMALPYPEATFLEAIASAYQAGQRTDDAIKSWAELYETARSAGFVFAAAEAAHSIGDLYQKKKEFAKAIPYYAQAADAWSKAGNGPRRIDALSSEAFLLGQTGQAGKAIHLYEELVMLARDAHDPRRQFLFHLSIAEITQATGNLDRALRALKDAESLLRPDLTLPGVDPSLVLELYQRMAGVYAKRSEPLPMVIALEKAMSPAEATGNGKTMGLVNRDVKDALTTLNAQQTADKAFQAADFATALTFYELVQHFEQLTAQWTGKADEYNRNLDNAALRKVIDLPFRIINQPEGAAALEVNLQQMGPIADTARFPALAALTHHYTAQGEAAMAARFATAALPFLRLEEAENGRPRRPDVQIICELAYALFLQKEVGPAAARAGQCLKSAKKFGDPVMLGFAHQINLWTLDAAGRQEDAQESARYLLQAKPGDPMHYVELAELQSRQEKFTEAVDSWRQALLLYEAGKEPLHIAAAHLQLARAMSQTPAAGSPTDSDEERSHLETALAMYRQLGDAEGQARTGAFLGLYYLRRKEEARAQEAFDTAFKMARQAKKPGLEAFILSDVANMRIQQGDPARALGYARKSAALYHDAGDLNGESSQLQAESAALENLNRPDEALETLLQARRVADASGDWLNRYWVRRAAARIFDRLGEYDNSLAALREARDISTAAGQPLNSAWASQALAGELTIVGDWEAALDAINLALPVFRRLKSTDDEFSALLTLMDVYGARESPFKDFDKALQYHAAARALLEKTDLARLASLAMTVEEIEWQQGRYKEASAHAEEALGYYTSSRDDWGATNALVSLAEAQRSAGNLPQAAANLQRAAALLKHIPGFYLNARYHYAQAGLFRRQNRFKEAIIEYGEVIAVLEQFKAGNSASLRRKVSENYGFIYNELAETWYQLGLSDPTQKLAAAGNALQYAELNKARVFTSSWGLTFVEALRRRLPARLQERERALDGRRQALQSELEQTMAGQGSRPVKQVQEDLKRLAAEQAALQKDLRQASPPYAEARYPQPVALADLPLRDGETFIEFKMLEDSLLVWIITGSPGGPQLSQFYKVDHPRSWFEERILGIRSAFNRGFPGQFEPEVSEELFNALFPAGIAQQVIAAQSLILSPDDILFLLPLELLSPQATRSQFVLLKTPTTYFPSAAALRLSRTITPAKREWPAEFFSLADPITTADDERYTAATVVAEVESAPAQPQAGNPLEVPRGGPQAALPPSATSGGSDGAATDTGPAPPTRGVLPIARLKSRGYFFERLPETATEAAGIAALFPANGGSDGVIVRTGMEARKSELLQTDLGRFRFIHFATHGFLPVEPGVREPALVLSYDGKAEDRMMLTLSEVLQLRLHAELVVLSACNTGSGRVTRAEGVSSMGSAFLAAGASSVTMSLWQVADKSTAVLMQEYYRNLLKGMKKNAALAAARVTLFAQGNTNPFFWAPFILTGE